MCSGEVSFQIPLSGLAISERHQHLCNLSQKLVDLLRRIYCCFGISKPVSCSSLLVATAAGANGSFQWCWEVKFIVIIIIIIIIVIIIIINASALVQLVTATD